MAEFQANFVLDHDVIPDGSGRPDQRGHILPRSELDVGVALERLI
jgi:hypothetical protein